MNVNQKGQTLIIIFFVMLVALSLGIGVSNRFISSLRVSSRTYTNYRAQAIAEAALERILLKSTQELQDFINFGSCGSDCTLTINNADGIVETATITLTYLGNSSDPYSVRLQQDAPAEVSLTGYPDNTNLQVCWNSPVGDSPSVVGSLINGSAGSYTADSFAYNSVDGTYLNGFSSASGSGGYASCFTLSSGSSPQMLRLRSIYNEADITVIPDPGATLPTQGILIESEGRVLDTTKKISVIKGNSVMPLPFDFALFSGSDVVPLSN